MSECIILLDSGYLTYISKFFGKGKLLKYKIEKFSVNLAKERNLSVKEIYYYTAPPFQSSKANEEENKRRANYDRFIQKIKGVKPKIIVREGRCQKIINQNKEEFTQKGVDTLLTMDLLKIAERKLAENIILMTSDTDFVPIIKDLQENYNIKVILAYFTDKRRKSAFSLSNHLWNICKDKILIKKEHFY
jgi:uncharacterized LabA/DUF88 family protein